jgi:hypothetical protein
MRGLKQFLGLLTIIFLFEVLHSHQQDHEEFIQLNLTSKMKKLKDVMKIIPKQEIGEIKNLFENLFRFNELGFTLFGDKPLSFCTLTVTDPSVFSRCNNISLYAEIILKCDKIYQKEWMTWQKYSNLFKISNYIFLVDECGILLAKKNELRKVIAENLELFLQILGKDFNCDNFINNI